MAGFLGDIQPLLRSDTAAVYARFRTEASQPLLKADEIVVNLTGGTTLMGMAVQHRMDRGRDLNRPIRR